MPGFDENASAFTHFPARAEALNGTSFLIEGIRERAVSRIESEAVESETRSR